MLHALVYALALHVCTLHFAFFILHFALCILPCLQPQTPNLQPFFSIISSFHHSIVSIIPVPSPFFPRQQS
jgi:hypothetical protein